jgi:hypothetical protein
MNLANGSIQENETFTDKLKKTTALVYYNSKFVSSGIIFKINDAVYCITAGHSIYGKKYNETKSKEDLIVKTKNTNLLVESVIGDAFFAKKHDIVILKIEKCDNFSGILNIEFLKTPQNPIHNLIFRGSHDPNKGIFNHRNNYFDETVNDCTKYRIETDKTKLVNHLYSHGSDWLQGISGSGIFYQDTQDKVHCCGIIVEIINKGNEGKLLCASIEPLVTLLPELSLIPSDKLDYDFNLSSLSLSKIIEAHSAQVISDWEKKPENDTEDNPRVSHINNKLPLIYPKSEFVVEKTRLIKNFSVGTYFLEVGLANNETLKAFYDDAYESYNLQEKTIYADTRKEARKTLGEIKEKYESYLHDMLEGKGFSRAIIILLKEYAISQWISNCSINIIKDE